MTQSMGMPDKFIAWLMAILGAVMYLLYLLDGYHTKTLIFAATFTILARVEFAELYHQRVALAQVEMVRQLCLRGGRP